MTSSLIQFKNLGLTFPGKCCFEGFTAQIYAGERIGLCGRNGSGKSSLLKILEGALLPSEGQLIVQNGLRLASVPQMIDEFSQLSGGQRFQRKLSMALAQMPEVLLLDEPTNHLDQDQRRSLMRMPHAFSGTLFIASHDEMLLHECTDTLWHFEQGKIHIFKGSYTDYFAEREIKRHGLETEVKHLKQKKQALHQHLMQEQVRAKHSRAQGQKHIQKRKWPTITSATKAGRAQQTAGLKRKALREQHEVVLRHLAELTPNEIIIPRFHFETPPGSHQILISISDGEVGYETPVLSHIHLSVQGQTRLALRGKNGSGKSTLAKAIFGEAALRKSGEWLTHKAHEMAYLDQHYSSLVPDDTILETIQKRAAWAPADIREFLTLFLFRKNEEVHRLVKHLSGGEKARLALACIAVKTPSLLILDEPTNNIDHETRQHLIQVLKAYPGALIAISHDESFLEAIGIEEGYEVNSLCRTFGQSASVIPKTTVLR